MTAAEAASKWPDCTCIRSVARAAGGHSSSRSNVRWSPRWSSSPRAASHGRSKATGTFINHAGGAASHGLSAVRTAARRPRRRCGTSKLSTSSTGSSEATTALAASDEPVDEVESLDVPHRLRGRREAVLPAESP